MCPPSFVNLVRNKVIIEVKLENLYSKAQLMYAESGINIVPLPDPASRISGVFRNLKRRTFSKVFKFSIFSTLNITIIFSPPMGQARKGPHPKFAPGIVSQLHVNCVYLQPTSDRVDGAERLSNLRCN